MYPVLFHLGSILIPAYGALAAVGVLLALLMAQRTARIAGLDARKVWNLCVVALFVALVSSRLLLVAFNWSELRVHPMWLLGLAMIHHPLLACFGGLAACVAAVLYGRWQRLPLWSTADALAAPVALGLAFEQLGALLAGSGYGIEAGKGIAARWAVTYTHPLAALWSGAPLEVALHPVQAYAALGFLTLSIFLLVLCQGMTSVVPKAQQTEERALAPEGSFFRFFPSSWWFLSPSYGVIPRDGARCWEARWMARRWRRWYWWWWEDWCCWNAKGRSKVENPPRRMTTKAAS